MNAPTNQEIIALRDEIPAHMTETKRRLDLILELRERPRHKQSDRPLFWLYTVGFSILAIALVFAIRIAYQMLH